MASLNQLLVDIYHLLVPQIPPVEKSEIELDYSKFRSFRVDNKLSKAAIKPHIETITGHSNQSKPGTYETVEIDLYSCVDDDMALIRTIYQKYAIRTSRVYGREKKLVDMDREIYFLWSNSTAVVAYPLDSLLQQEAKNVANKLRRYSAWKHGDSGMRQNDKYTSYPIRHHYTAKVTKEGSLLDVKIEVSIYMVRLWSHFQPDELIEVFPLREKTITIDPSKFKIT